MKSRKQNHSLEEYQTVNMDVILCLLAMSIITDINQWTTCIPETASPDMVCACRVDWLRIHRCTTKARCQVSLLKTQITSSDTE